MVEGGKDVKGEEGHLQDLLIGMIRYFCLEARGC